MPEPEWCWELRMLAWFLMTAGPMLFAVTVVTARLTADVGINIP